MVVEEGLRLARGLGSFATWNDTGASYLAASVLALLMQAFVPESALDVDPDCDPDELELLHALRSGRYRVEVPEEAALGVAVLLLDLGSLSRQARPAHGDASRPYSPHGYLARRKSLDANLGYLSPPKPAPSPPI